jgi:carbon-monoxide dehydrogenase medium subunit
MYPASFEYHAPLALDEAIGLLSELGDEAKVLAGGCSLIPIMKLRLAEPGHLFDLRRITGLQGITIADDMLRIGAMTREAELEASPLVARHAPLVAETSSVIADPLVRNMGTVGGNIAHADPANDHPATMLALDASFEITGPAGSRLVDAGSFFVDLYETVLGPGELVTAILVPGMTAGSGAAYHKLERQVGDFAIVAAAAWLRLEQGIVQAVRVALTNVAPTPRRATAAEAALVGQAPTDSAVRAAGDAAVEGLEPWDELRGSARYKLEVTPVVVRRALASAVQRATGSRDGDHE